MSVTCALSAVNAAAVKQPPHTHPLSSGRTAGASKLPDSGGANVDQCPKAMRVSCVCRLGTAYHGIKPAGASVALPLKSKSMRPLASHRRMRVRALITKRVSSKSDHAFLSASEGHWLGWLPYMFLKNAMCWSPVKPDEAAFASARVCARVHCGNTPACTINQPCASMASGWRRSQLNRASLSGAWQMSSRVSCRFKRAPARPTASRCKS